MTAYPLFCVLFFISQKGDRDVRTIQQQLKEKGLSEGAGTKEAFPNTKGQHQTKRTTDIMGTGRTDGQ